jgi:predicted nucleic acid-binding protein
VILVDTSIWIDHLRANDARLAALLQAEEVLTHPFIIGELAMGNLRARKLVLETLQRLPKAPPATDDEVLHLIDKHALHGRGIGYVDAHLLAAAKLAGEKLWSRDRRLAFVAEQLSLAALV